VIAAVSRRPISAVIARESGRSSTPFDLEKNAVRAISRPGLLDASLSRGMTPLCVGKPS
jgi:hypothetical protein